MRLSPKWWIGPLFILPVLSFAIAFFIREKPKTLTLEELQAARHRWEETAPDSYEMDVLITGVQQGNYHVVIQEGKVVSMTADNVEVTGQARQHWSVEGMFEFLEQEIAHKEHPLIVYAVQNSSKVYITADFDLRFGYPRRFLRQVFGQKFTIEWKVENFTLLED